MGTSTMPNHDLPTTPVERCTLVVAHNPHDHRPASFVAAWCDGMTEQEPPCRQIQPGRWVGSCVRNAGHEGDHLRHQGGGLGWARWDQSSRSISFSLSKEPPTDEMVAEVFRNTHDVRQFTRP